MWRGMSANVRFTRPSSSGLRPAPSRRPPRLLGLITRQPPPDDERVLALGRCVVLGLSAIRGERASDQGNLMVTEEPHVGLRRIAGISSPLRHDLSSPI